MSGEGVTDSRQYLETLLINDKNIIVLIAINPYNFKEKQKNNVSIKYKIVNYGPNIFPLIVGRSYKVRLLGKPTISKGILYLQEIEVIGLS